MHPVLFKIGPLTVHTYGFFLAIGFFVGMTVAVREAKRLGMNHEQIMDLCLYSLIAAILGARVPYVVLNWEDFSGNLSEIPRLWRGGLVFYGGFLGGAAMFFFYVWRHKLPKLRVADVLALGVALGHAVGRWGCFSAGCCYGKPTDLPWAVTFTDPACLAPLDVPLHPTQVYESLINLGLFLFLYFYLRPRKRFDGAIFIAFVFLYSICRFFLEFLRADNRGAAVFLDLSPTQVLSLVLVGLAAVFWFVVKEKSRQ